MGRNKGREGAVLALGTWGGAPRVGVISSQRTIGGKGPGNGSKKEHDLGSLHKERLEGLTGVERRRGETSISVTYQHGKGKAKKDSDSARKEICKKF